MNIYVGVDDTICYREDNKDDYTLSIPYKERIEKINKLYNEGNIITYWTSRDTKPGMKWFHFTFNQLKNWGCKFHNLSSLKPNYDMIIDSKAENFSIFQK